MREIINKIKLRRQSTILKKYYNKRFKFLKRGEDNLILFGTPEYCNMGDNALAIAELDFLREYFPDHNIIEISDRLYKYKKEEIIKFIKPRDTLFITGGGFLGSLWMDGENLARDIIINFPSNKIIIFPQTIFFEDNEKGKLEYNKTKTIWESNKNLLVFTREKKSYEFIKKNFNNQPVKLYPDMVLRGLNFKCDNINRKKHVLVCLRKDKESILGNTLTEYLKNIFKELNISSYEEIDTIVWENFSYENRENCLYGLLEKFISSQLVITDKLHGMIFSVISGTPCLFFDNKSNKLSGVYKWIEQLPYIKQVTIKDDIKKEIENFFYINLKYEYDKKLLIKEFDNMVNSIKEWLEKGEVN